MRIKFFGAAGGVVTGSCYWLQGEKGGLVVDMGMFQGTIPISERRKSHNLNSRLRRQIPMSDFADEKPLTSRELNAKWPEIFIGGGPTSEQSPKATDSDEKPLVGVLVTHAHLDHGGRLPLLVKMGYKGKVYMTAATRDLMELSLRDTVKISKEHGGDALFGEKEVEQILSQVELLEIGEEKALGEFKVGFLRAGHILGAVSVLVEAEGKRVMFSGDIGTGESPLIKPPEPPEKAGVVILESTYGDRLHEAENEKEILAEEIAKTYESRGVLLLPVFSIQRSQRILHLLDHLQKEKRLPQGMKVYFDSPMAIEATQIFGKYRQEYGGELSGHAKKDDPFDFPGLVITRHAWEKKIIRKDKGAKIIVAGSGMMSGGRIMGHAKEYLSKINTRLLMVGYQAVGTLGRQIVDGDRFVNIDGVEVEVNARVRQIHSMSAHADQKQLLEWLSKIKGVKKVILTHGENGPRQVLGELIKTGSTSEQTPSGSSSDEKPEILKPKLGDEIVI